MSNPYDIDRSLSKKRLLKFVQFRSHLQSLLKIKNNIHNYNNIHNIHNIPGESQNQLLLDIQHELLWFHDEHERYNKNDQLQFLQLLICLIYEVFPYISKENKSKLYDLHRNAFFYL